MDDLIAVCIMFFKCGEQVDFCKMFDVDRHGEKRLPKQEVDDGEVFEHGKIEIDVKTVVRSPPPTTLSKP